ncbi:DExH-box ATP-dependent RNA helicase DExH3, partial [Bienertia sinuspersici]
VGYKVRLEGMKGKNTHLLFCISGILLRRLLSDRNLNGVTHVFVDEIHERGMNEDFLLIVLKDLLPRRRDLRLILMSATLNAELFSNYFGGAPTIHIPVSIEMLPDVTKNCLQNKLTFVIAYLFIVFLNFYNELLGPFV